jgi:hypothetical protein
MRGVITGRDALKNLPLICVEFGVGCAFRVLNAVLRGEKTTFLEVVFKLPTAVELDGSEPLR